MVEGGRRAGDKVAMSSAVRDERIRMHVIDKFVDKIVVLLELIGECGSVEQMSERLACTCC